MSLSGILERADARRKTVEVCNHAGGDRDLDAVLAYVDNHDVDVERVDDPTAPADAIRVVDADGTPLATDPIDAVREYLLGWKEAGGGRSFEGLPDRPGVLDALDDTVFHSYDRGRMVLASRTVEQRAARDGTGTLHAGFQRLSNVDPQLDTYERLADRCRVRVYGVPDAEVDADRVEVVGADVPEVRDHWWVAYGGDDATEVGVLLAREEAPGEFRGFWTFRRPTVEDVVDHLESTYH